MVEKEEFGSTDPFYIGGLFVLLFQWGNGTEWYIGLITYALGVPLGMLFWNTFSRKKTEYYEEV